MNFHTLAIATLLTISTVAGLPTTASANSRFDYLDRGNNVQAQAAQPEIPQTISPQMVQPQPENPKTTRNQQIEKSQASTMTQKDSGINVKDIQPAYCRYLFPLSGTVTLFEYSEGLYHCQYGN